MVNKQQQLSDVFSALSDPTRRKILERLFRHGETRVTTLAKPFRLSLPAISKHLRVLENAKLILREKQGREHHIRANLDTLRGVQDWIQQAIEVWDARFDALDEFLESEKQKRQKDQSS